VYDRMREFSEMTAEGADIFMGAFAHLKNFPFFTRLQAWFTPFDAGNTEVARGMEGEMTAFVDALVHMPLPCDNDKFSILFSLGATPAAQREMLARQLEANREAMEQSMKGNGDAGFTRAYVQNLYRFYKLYGRRSEFFDPFARGIFLQDIDMLQSAVRNADTLRASAQLLFSIDAWADARACYELLGSIDEPTAEIYQKTAFCLEQLGQYAEAADNYGFADLMDGSNEWTLRRLAHTLAMAGRYERAAAVYERLLSRKPGDRHLTKRLAYTLIKTGEYARAAELLRQLADGESTSPDILRALAWSTFVSGDADAARGYYREILRAGAEATDYLNMGHLAWVEGRMADAIKLYGKYVEDAKTDIDGLERDIRADLPALAAYNLNLFDLPLLLDSVRMARG
ncbi:MAG: tetratricopeptide repeat protein, partial [Muribaculaceae bacterium]|nr:tetratricopeptide repeat protein [Muribaculaceae bacterium]